MAKEKTGTVAPKKATAKAVAPKKKSTTKSTAKNKAPKSKAKGKKKGSKNTFSAKVKGVFVTAGNKVVNFGKASKAVVAGRLRALADVIDSDK